ASVPLNPGRARTRCWRVRQRSDLLARRIGLEAGRRSTSAAVFHRASMSMSANGARSPAVARSGRAYSATGDRAGRGIGTVRKAADRPEHPLGPLVEIGRASCGERVEILGVAAL